MDNVHHITRQDGIEVVHVRLKVLAAAAVLVRSPVEDHFGGVGVRIGRVLVPVEEHFGGAGGGSCARCEEGWVTARLGARPVVLSLIGNVSDY